MRNPFLAPGPYMNQAAAGFGLRAMVGGLPLQASPLPDPKGLFHPFLHNLLPRLHVPSENLPSHFTAKGETIRRDYIHRPQLIIPYLLPSCPTSSALLPLCHRGSTWVLTSIQPHIWGSRAHILCLLQEITPAVLALLLAHSHKLSTVQSSLLS